MEIRIITRDRDTGLKLDLPGSFYLTPYMCERYSRKPRELAAFVHDGLAEMLKHEVSESVWHAGRRVREPIHFGAADHFVNVNE